MSNLIKYPFVNLAGKEAVVINNNVDEKFVPLHESRVKIRTIGEIETEKALLRAREGSQEENDEDKESGDFKSGLKVTNFDQLFQEQKKKAEANAEEILADAKKEAERIKEEAQTALDIARARGYEEGKEQGFQDGTALAEQEIRNKEQEFEENMILQKQEIQDCLVSVEEKYVDIVIALVKKLTGIVVEGKDDLILYLIRTAASELEKSENYRIRVSPEDVYYLESRKRELLDTLGDEAFLEFVEEKGLEKGQCIIETDHQMVDCGLQTQLDTLVNDLKMLVQ